MSDLRHQLDYNNLYDLTLHYDAQRGNITASVADRNQPWERLRSNIAEQLSLEADPAGSGSAMRRHPRKNEPVVTFSNTPPRFKLKLGNEVIGHYEAAGDQLHPLDKPRLLNVTEMRRLGSFHTTAPYSQHRNQLSREQNKELLDVAKSSVFTDFHTHSSGQISSAGLLKVARDKPTYYPIDMLEEIGIDRLFPKHMVKEIPRVKFAPTERPGLPDMIMGVRMDALTEEELKILANKMSVPADKQSTFTEMEMDAYRFRYPLSKDTSIFKETWKEVAREYARQGITHAEITFNDLDKPEIFTALMEAMEEIKTDPEAHDVQLRFHVGIPRTYPIDKIREVLDKARILTESPYVVGVDFIGYEVNQTKEFKDALHDFAAWANEYRPGMTLKAHAGENDKNVENVNQFLQLLKQHPNLRGRIGHGIYGMNDATLKLAREIANQPPGSSRLVFEYNPASNVALNNIDDVRDIPFRKALEHDIPFVVGSDSSGIYQTDAKQLGLDAYYAGLNLDDLHTLEQHQRDLVDRQNEYSHSVAMNHPGWNSAVGVQRLLEKLKGVQPAQLPTEKPLSHEEIREKLRSKGVRPVEPGTVPPELAHKAPIAIVGASGSNWKRMRKDGQTETATLTEMLVRALDPEKCYFVFGRDKNSGLSKALTQSVKDANAYHTERGRGMFFKYGIIADPRFDEDKSDYSHLTHMEHVRGGLLSIADAIVNHLFHGGKTQQGVLIAAGGAAFTRDIITKADQRGMRDAAHDNERMMLLMANAKGASAEKAKVLHPDYHTPDAVNAIRKLYENQPQLFTKEFKIGKLEHYYQEAKQRVMDRNDQTVQPSPDNQQVGEAVTLPTKSRGRA